MYTFQLLNTFDHELLTIKLIYNKIQLSFLHIISSKLGTNEVKSLAKFQCELPKLSRVRNCK